jgi:hypothetical protein
MAAPPAVPGGWPLAPRATPTPDVTPALDAVRATSTAVMAALAPRDAALTTLVGDWQVAVVHAWVADLPPEYGAPVGRRSVLIDLAAVNMHTDRSLRWEWLQQAQALTLLSSDRRYLDLEPDAGVGGHPLLRAAAAAACPEGGMPAVGEVETLVGGAAARGVTVPPRMPVRALALFTLPADDAPPDAWMLQIRLPDGSARVRLALALTPAPGADADAGGVRPGAHADADAGGVRPDAGVGRVDGGGCAAAGGACAGSGGGAVGGLAGLGTHARGGAAGRTGGMGGGDALRDDRGDHGGCRQPPGEKPPLAANRLDRGCLRAIRGGDGADDHAGSGHPGADHADGAVVAAA